jgi:hypothetical protein
MADPNEIRARSLRRDIFARHFIPQDVSDEDAIKWIEDRAQLHKQAPAGWANPEERATARAEYAKVGSTPDEVQKRWEESIYLVDPATHEFRQRFLRDKEFLERMTGVDASRSMADAGRGYSPAKAALQQAVVAWDATNNNPLYRNNWRDSGGWKSQDGVGMATANAVSNPDLTSGQYLGMTELIPDFLRMQGSGESETANDSWRTATGKYMMQTDVRPDSPAPILDLPSGSSPEAIRQRLAELRELQGAAAIPDAGERWQRTAGFTPAPFLQDMGDASMSSADPTILFPMAGAAKAIGTAAKIGGRAAMGTAAAGAARGLAADHLMEQGTTAGIIGAIGANPERTWADYVNLIPEPAKLKSPAEVQAANEARQRQYGQGMERRASVPGVSTADAEAYKRLQQSGLAPSRTNL